MLIFTVKNKYGYNEEFVIMERGLQNGLEFLKKLELIPLTLKECKPSFSGIWTIKL